MTKPQLDMDSARYWLALEESLMAEDGSVAAGHLAAGNAVYVIDQGTRPDTVTKIYPDGRRETVKFDPEGEHAL